MAKIKSIKKSIIQITALTEKNLALELRFKANFMFRFLNPLIQLFIFFFLFGAIFSLNSGFNLGYWTSSNYITFLCLAYCVQFSKSITQKYNQLFTVEKYWKTLSALMVAPMNRFTLLFSVLISELLISSIPIVILVIIAWIFSPISIFFVFLSLLVLISIFLIFGGMGLLIGVFTISHENYVHYSFIFLRFIFLLSCINYPKEIFPEFIQFFIILNPLYYIFDLLRLTWNLGIDFSSTVMLITPLHIVVIIIATLLIPLISIKLFDKIYKKYGITGY